MVKAAVSFDKFILTHRFLFSPSGCRDPMGGRVGKSLKFVMKNPPQFVLKFGSIESWACLILPYEGHVISVCPALQQKSNPSPEKSNDGVH